MINVVVEPEQSDDRSYYSRFGFTRASDADIANEFGARNAFMIVALAGELPSGGLARYCDEFRGV